MMDRLDAAQGFEFLNGARAVAVVRSLEIAMNELDGFEQSPGGFGFPDFTESTPAEPLDELIARNGFRVRFNPYRHRHPRTGSQAAGATRRPTTTHPPLPTLALRVNIRKF